MKPITTYEEYVRDDEFLSYYNDYQAKYAEQIRESDKVILKLVADITKGRGSVLDIGCSTGNLLLHLKRTLPELELTGGELVDSSLEIARANKELSGVQFKTMDMLDIPGQWDVIIANAVAVYFEYDVYADALRSVCKALKPGGYYIAFEWLHPFNQSVKVEETCLSHPQGLTIYARPYRRVEDLAEKAGFESVEFHAFEIPIDLPLLDYDGDTITHTIARADNGKRLTMRGVINQPWCHLVARKGTPS